MGYNNSFIDTVAGQEFLHYVQLYLKKISDSLETIAKHMNEEDKENEK